MDFRQAPIRIRDPGKLSTTTYVNELAIAFNHSMNLGDLGQAAQDGYGFEWVICVPTTIQNTRVGWYSAKTYGNRPAATKADVSSKKPLKDADLGTQSKDVDLTLWNIGEIKGSGALAIGTPVLGLLIGTDSDGQSLAIAVPSASITPCRVKQNGGVAGGATTTCTFTYDIYAMDNSTLITPSGTHVTPKNWRFSTVTYTAATYGQYFIDADGSYALLLWNEAPAGTACPS